ncbi:hypothetical protein DM02DRAFT_648947 [Periconia macrospinosa]|uniref:Uncharacterized protein n=1 Tax=Periconia macrospinosa TaxID=97972 RepID=A0A2V1EA97_9PLEO|nr:hypothetical protein DM02DRAFT_648947 [Periconia macrospinosa]
MAATDDAESLIQRMRELADRESPDRSSRLQVLCKEAWTLLQRDEHGSLVPAFLHLLQDPDDLSLASLVLPHLRPGAEPPQHPRQREVVEGTLNATTALGNILKRTQAYYDRKNPLYAAEKRILQDAEMYRASLLLCNSGFLTPEESDLVRKWIDDCPIKAGTRETDSIPLR